MSTNGAAGGKELISMQNFIQKFLFVLIGCKFSFCEGQNVGLCVHDKAGHIIFIHLQPSAVQGGNAFRLLGVEPG